MSDYVELKILRATPKMPARWNDPDSYDVQLQLSRPLTCHEGGVLKRIFPDVSVKDSVITVHNTTIDEIRDCAPEYAAQMRLIEETGREEEAEARRKHLEEAAALEKERKRREAVAASIVFE
ncbi:hypothetical protein [Mobiluncus mulieris]|uniref:Uncharacterized protein n=1 Tax=Mobiluncus mulieris TaxID=2052 RepID=A0A7Y0U0I8_9ACTO|nr:hypothetical protein [Mobiluncus mulieris]NMW64597.1 hypothetical protein [Mobiluncus mulieris]NMX02819.1 hypothetical protein [Mobiluncus mulieris]